MCNMQRRDQQSQNLDANVQLLEPAHVCVMQYRMPLRQNS
jgi:hypothetical protein